MKNWTWDSLGIWLRMKVMWRIESQITYTAALCMAEQVCSMVVLALGLFGDKHLVELFPAQSFLHRLERSIISEGSTMCFSRSWMSMGSGWQESQLCFVWCFNQKNSLAAIFQRLFTISILTISLTVTCGIKIEKYFCEWIIPYWKQHTVLLRQGNKVLLGCCNSLL